MAITREQLESWVGSDFLVVEEPAHLSDWADPEWRAQFLAQQVSFDLSYLHAEPNQASGTVAVFYARRRL